MTTINNALTGAIAAQAGLNTTSQNVANAMTEGYTRQGVLLSAVAPSRAGVGAAGDGVTVAGLVRFSDAYKCLQMWSAASNNGQRAATQPYLTQLEQVMGNIDGGINKGLDEFFGAINAASVEPSSVPLRQQVVIAADALGKRVNSLQSLLATQRSAVYNQRSASVDQINSSAADIAMLNEKIVTSASGGVNPSGLIDERDRKIDQLARLVGIQVVDQPNGARSISLRAGQPLVVGNTPGKLAVNMTPSGTQELKVTFTTQTFGVLPGNIGGELGGLDDFETQTLNPMRDSIRELADEISTRFNATLGAGFKPDGTAGTDLFVFDPSSATNMLSIKPGFIGSDLAFSSSAAEAGNSDNVHNLLAIRNQPVPITALGNVLLGDTYTQLVGRLGMLSQQNLVELETSDTVRMQAVDSWKQTSGVNQDEEAVNLMQYQQMYQANMKVVSVANELFDAMIQMM